MNWFQNRWLKPTNFAFCFSDPAGANACLALAKMISSDARSISLYTNRSHISNQEAVSFTESLPSLEGIDTVFLGTSHPESSKYFELNCLKEAKSKDVYTISFIDHWVNFKLRFTDVNNELIFPDEIWVVDERAKELAVNEGLPAGLIIVTGNPYHEYLRHYWKSMWPGKSYLGSLGIKEKGFHILFAPDPLSLRNNKESIGFTEVEAFASILRIIEEMKDEDLHLIVKCHPLQPKGLIKDVLDNKEGFNVTLIQDADTLELIEATDVVIGFFSNILLDAEALGKKVFRYFPGKEEADLMSHNQTLLKIKEVSKLRSHLKKIIYG